MGVTVSHEQHGVAHCFRCGHVETRECRRELSQAERKAFARRMDALRKQHDHEQRQLQARAAAAAVLRWAAAVPAEAHPYLTRKSIQAHGARIETGNTLLIPLRDTKGQLHSLQAITASGDKFFMPNGKVKGCYFSMGAPSGKLVICEGFATGATICEETGHAVAVAFNSGNLLPVAKALRSKFPCLTLVLAADDDWKTPGNPGLTAAKEAARAVGGLIAKPTFDGLPRGDRDTDFNDQARLERESEVSS
jgi:putative DNA primase/helicase